MLSEKRILVVEAEFLMALDLQRVLEDAHAAQTVFARSTAEAATLVDRFADFDLAIVEVPDANTAAVRLARDLLAAGVAVVASSVDASLQHGLPGLPGVPVVRKPFGDVDLLTACTIALALAPNEPEASAAGGAT